MAASPVNNIIDAHHHLWRYNASDYAWISPDMASLQRNFLPADLEQEMSSCVFEDQSRITGSVVVQARQSIQETQWLLDLADATPSILGVVGWLPLLSPSLPDLLKAFVSHTRLKGVRHVVQDEPDDNFLLREDFNRGIDHLLDTGLVYDILIHQHQLPQAARFVRRHPQQAFVLDHLAKPLIRAGSLQPWQDNLERLAQNPNVSCKLSGLVTEADWSNWTPEQLEPCLDAAFRFFGPDRLLAGSDWPVCLLAAGYRQWWTLLAEWTGKLPHSDRRRILSSNARRIYRLA